MMVSSMETTRAFRPSTLTNRADWMRRSVQRNLARRGANAVRTPKKPIYGIPFSFALRIIGSQTSRPSS